MDAHDLFRKLSAGAKFNKSKFYNDALKFQMVKPRPLMPLPLTTNTEEALTSNENTKDQSVLSSDVLTEKHTLEENVKLFAGNNTNGEAPRGKKRKKSKRTDEELAALQRQEEINHKRKQHRIYVQGTDIPEPAESFEQLAQLYGIEEDILNNIRNCGYDAPTPIQMQSVPLMLQGREILACAPTGSGKTAAFLIPIIQRLKGPQKSGFRAVIVAPTRELAQQIYRECLRLSEGRNLRCHIIDNIQKAAQKFGPKSSQRFDILVTTPNRLVYLLQQEPPAISLKNVEYLIVDESDKLFETGKSGFREQLGVIYKACGSGHTRRALFSATFAYDVEQWCKLNLDNVVMVTVGQRNSAAEIVEQQLVFVGNESGKLMAFRNLIREGLTPPVLVFVQTKERAKELFNELIYDGINVDVIHAERSQLQRDNVVKSFRMGHIWVLICTELMGRGIDFKGVNLVVNYDFPPSAISYIHRIGRTGRAGRPGRAITFFTEDDSTNLRSIAQVMRDSGCEVPEYMLHMKKPNKSKKSKLTAKKPQKRKRISTEPILDVKRRERLKRSIEASKKKKSATTNGETVKPKTKNSNKKSE